MNQPKRLVEELGSLADQSPIQQILYDWIIDKRSDYLPVTFEDIQDKMLSLLPEPKVFKASYGWLKGFVSRYNLSNRIITGTNGKDLTEKAKKERMTSFIKANPAEKIINMDQTPVWLLQVKQLKDPRMSMVIFQRD